MREFSPATDKNICSSAALLSCIALTPQRALALASAATPAEGTRLSPAQPGPARGPPSPGQGPPTQRVWSTWMRGSAFALRTEMLLSYNYAEELCVFQFRVTGFMQSSRRGVQQYQSFKEQSVTQKQLQRFWTTNRPSLLTGRKGRKSTFGSYYSKLIIMFYSPNFLKILSKTAACSKVEFVSLDTQRWWDIRWNVLSVKGTLQTSTNGLEIKLSFHTNTLYHCECYM